MPHAASKLLTGALALLSALPAAALEDILPRPATCVPVLTVHKADCGVVIVLRCGTGETTYFRHEEYQDGLPDALSHTSPNGDLIQLSFADGTVSIEAQPGSARPSPDALTAAGSARVEGEYVLTIIGITRKARLTEVIHADAAPFRIGDSLLRRYSSETVLALPAPMPTFTGVTSYYYDDTTGTLFEGEAHIDVLDDDGEGLRAVPTRLIRPGEPGFDSPEPDPDCQSISALPTEDTPWRA